MAPGLDVTVDGPVVRAVLDRGDGNLLTTETCQRLTELLLDPPASAHVLRLSARGPSFCLGRERAARDAPALDAEIGALVALSRALRRSPLVVVAEVHGDAAGFGVALAALATVSIAAPSARFWFPEVEIGLAPVLVLSWLPRVVGRKRAFDLTATARRLAAAEALELGLLTAVAPSDGALAATVDDYVAALRKHLAGVHAQIAGFLEASADLTQEQAEELAGGKLVLASLAAHSG
jgi:methylglutaconyl-CoA hydratase